MEADMLTRRQTWTGLGVSAILMPSVLRAQSAWPNQTIKIVVPFTPGGSTDILARVLAAKLEPVLKQTIIVENRPGAGGSIGAQAVARAEADGHTLLMGHIGTLAFNPSLYPALPYDAVKDFSPIALVARVPNILAVHPSVPAKTFAEFIAYAKANPGKLNYGSGGNGSAAHVAGAYFGFAAGFEAVHVPYRGTGPMVNDLASGAIQFTLSGGPAVLPLATGGQLRVLAVSSKARVPFAPELPTMIEGGLANFEADQWYGLVAPAKTPEAIVKRLNNEINMLMDNPEIANNLKNEGALAIRTTPEAFGAHIQSEITVWREVIRRAAIKAS
jgi:tripartite-type tricarboxylate transporter receptor subunit TctC